VFLCVSIALLQRASGTVTGGDGPGCPLKGIWKREKAIGFFLPEMKSIQCRQQKINSLQRKSCLAPLIRREKNYPDLMDPGSRAEAMGKGNRVWLPFLHLAEGVRRSVWDGEVGILPMIWNPIGAGSFWTDADLPLEKIQHLLPAVSYGDQSSEKNPPEPWR
jgi:hypothetical protein